MRLDRLLALAACITFPAWSGFSQTIPERVSHSPLTFEPNLGQSSSDAAFIANRPAYRLAIGASAITYSIPTVTSDTGAVNMRILRLRWTGHSREAKFEPHGLLPGKSNYLVGSDSSKWISNLAHYAEITEIGAMDGVDVRYYSSGAGELEYDLIVSPDTDLSSVGLSIEGADRVRLDKGGALSINVAGKEVRQLAPIAYEMRGTRRFALNASYILRNNQVMFSVPNRTPGSQLIIDPVLQYATYLGVTDPMYHWMDEGGPGSYGFSTAVDPAGNFFVAGQTYAFDFPVTRGALLPPCPDRPDLGAACTYTPLGFVTKFSRSGQLLYSTYFGGPTGLIPYYQPSGKVIAVDENGYAYITGGAYGDFPTTPGAYQRTCRSTGGGCAFLAKLNQNGSGLVYSTLFGGSGGVPVLFNGGTFANGLALGRNGDVYVVGGTHDATLPTTPGVPQTACPINTDGSCYSGFVARFNVNTNGPASLMFSTYLGVAQGQSEAAAVATDLYSDVYVVGLSTVDMPFLVDFGTGMMPYGYNACYDFGVACETFVAKLSGNYGQPLRKPTLLRGVTGSAIAVDNELNTFVAGTATSGFRTTSGAFQPSFKGGTTDGFIIKLSPSGYKLLFSTFLGGSGDEGVSDIAVNSYGMAFIAGSTNSADFPLAPGAFRKTVASSFVTALNSDGRSLYYSSYLGASGTSASGIALDKAWNAIVAGTAGGDFPVTAGALQSKYAGFDDAFVAKVAIAEDLLATVRTSVSSIERGGVVIYHARLTNLGPDGSDNVAFTTAIPAGTSYAGVYVPNGDGCSEPAYAATAGTLTCRKKRLEKGQTYYVNVYLRAIGASGTNVTGQFKVSAQTQDMWPENNTATATVLIQ